MIPASWHVVWKMFVEDTPTSPEVIVANTLNFKPNFKFSRLEFFGGSIPTKHFPYDVPRGRDHNIGITFGRPVP